MAGAPGLGVSTYSWGETDSTRWLTGRWVERKGEACRLAPDGLVGSRSSAKRAKARSDLSQLHPQVPEWQLAHQGAQYLFE